MKIVQLGSNRGNDHVFDLIKDKKIDFLLLVEPNPFVIDELKNCYSNIENVYIENVAIKPRNYQYDEIDLYYSEENKPHCEAASLFANHLLNNKFSRDSVKSMKVKCITIDDLFEKYKVDDLDYLFIDIEGLDEKIITEIKFTKYNIKNIQFEYLHINWIKISRFLETKGYIPDNQIGSSSNDILMRKIR